MAGPPMSRAAARKPTQTATRNTTGKITRRSTRFGHKLVTIHVGLTKTPFAIHEDLLCSNSNYFKNLLQKGRKDINGQCSICTDDLSRFASICYCTTCGQNMHTKCLADWLSTEQTCPLCRAEWQAPGRSNEVEGDRLMEDFSDTCFNLYMHWLYTGSVIVDEEGNSDSWPTLLLANTFGGLLDDEPFLKTVQKEIVGSKKYTRAALEFRYINYTSIFTVENPAARKFLVDLYLAQEEPPNLDSEYNRQFIIDVAQALLSRRTEKDRDRSMLAAYLSEDVNVLEN